MEWFLGLDIGTTATKACAFDRSGTMRAESLRSYPLREPEIGAAEQDPEQIRQAAEDCLREVTQKMNGQPLAIGMSTAMHTLIAVDAAGRPLTPSYTYADTRSHAAIAGWDAKTRSEIYQACGAPIHAMLPLAKIAWLKQTQPDTFDRADCFIDIKAYLLERWTGQRVTDHGIASSFGLLEVAERRWFAPALELLGIGPERLPGLCAPTATFAFRRDRGKSLGLEGVPLVAGGSDGCLANLGAGILKPGPVSLTIGTSGAVRMTHRAFCPDPKERLFSYVLDAGLYVTGGASNNGGKILEWVRDVFFPEKEIGAIIEEALTVAPGSEGLLFAPYLYGERAPVWNAEATGRLSGLRSLHRREHIARATLEGILFNLYATLERLDDLSDPVTEIYANGGFTRTDGWVQLLADITGLPVSVAETPQASAYGAALMARKAGGDIDGWSELAGHLRVEKSFVPDAGRYTLYQDRYRAFRALIFSDRPPR